jgi:hypothetical protein
MKLTRTGVISIATAVAVTTIGVGALPAQAADPVKPERVSQELWDTLSTEDKTLATQVPFGTIDVFPGDPAAASAEASTQAAGAYNPGINDDELRYCLLHWDDCISAKSLEDRAVNLVNSNPEFANSGRNGRGDAFRHCVWSAFITISEGRDAAYEITTRHETGNEEAPQVEVDMDLANNAQGMEIGQHIRDNGGTEDVNNAHDGAYANCAVRASTGQLTTIA